jgi:AraC-like DNA-binding protein
MGTTGSSTIPASYGLALLALMAERGHPADQVLASTPLSLASLQGQHAQISIPHYALMLQQALSLDVDGSLPYELGLRSQVTRHGFVGFGLMSCATLREAIVFSQRYFQARVPLFDTELVVDAQQATVILHERVPLGPLRRAVFDIALVELCCLFAKVMGTEPSLSGWISTVSVPYPEPPGYGRYQNRLPPFHFQAAAAQIRFPAAMLDAPIATADPSSVQLAIERCEQEMASQGHQASTTAQVRARLQCRDGRYPDVAAMAHTLHTSERTLKRRLQDEGSSFQALLDQARRQDSLRLLAKPTLAIKQVAEAVGYTDPANFARAFTKWAGCSPRAWRQQQGLVD